MAGRRLILLLATLALSGCVTTPAVPVVARGEAYVPVHDVPAERATPTLTVSERERISATLLSARADVARKVEAAAKIDAERDEADRRAQEKRRIEAEARPAEDGATVSERP